MLNVAARMAGATVFSTWDAKTGFWQLKLHKKSSFLTAFSTLFRRYRYLRMPFGINTASEMCQRTMEQLWVTRVRLLLMIYWSGAVMTQNMIAISRK